MSFIWYLGTALHSRGVMGHATLWNQFIGKWMERYYLGVIYIRAIFLVGGIKFDADKKHHIFLRDFLFLVMCK